MKKLVKILSAALIFSLCLLMIEAQYSRVEAAKKYKVSTNAKLDDAKTMKTGKTYTVKIGDVDDDEFCYVKFKLKKDCNVEVTTTITSGYSLGTAIRSEDVRMFGYYNVCYGESGKEYQTSTVDSTEGGKLPKGTYYLRLNPDKKDRLGAKAPTTAKIKIKVK